jgi:hypothetical protein
MKSDKDIIDYTATEKENNNENEDQYSHYKILHNLTLL